MTYVMVFFDPSFLLLHSIVLYYNALRGAPELRSINGRRDGVARRRPCPRLERKFVRARPKLALG